MGMNAILVFFFHGLSGSILDAVFWQDDSELSTDKSKHRFMDWLQNGVFGVHTDDHTGGYCAPCQLAFVLGKIAIFMLVTWRCAKVGYFWKL